MSPKLTAVKELLQCTVDGMKDSPIPTDSTRAEYIKLVTRAQEDLAKVTEKDPTPEGPLALSRTAIDCVIDHLAFSSNFEGDAGELQNVIDGMGQIVEAE